MAKGFMTRRSGNLPSTAYEGNMIEFFSIPGASGKIRLKVEKPIDADGVMLRHKTTAWANGDTKDTGTLVANITDDTNYKGANQWYESTGLTNGTAYYFKAFPHKSGAYNETIGQNETVCKAGSLFSEYTMDSISGSTINDTSGNSRNGSLGGCVSASATIGNGIDKASSATSAQINSFPSTPMSFSFIIKTNRNGYPFYLYNGSYGLLSVNYNGSQIQFSGSSPLSFSVASGSTNHFVVIIAGNTGTVYMNGANQGTYTMTTSGITYKYFCGANSSSDLSCGIVDQFRIYDRELELYEIANIYNGGAGC